LIAKKHEHGNETVLAVCDKEHLGKTFEDGKIFFEVRKKFYGEDVVNEDELRQLLEEASSANLFGNKCVNFAIKKGLISESNAISIKGIKHAQIYKI